jgi:hypothetical protein
MGRANGRILCLALTTALLVAACGDSSDDGGPEADGGGTTRHVPDDYATIQEAVDAASPGDLVLIEPGTYHEEVNVTTPDLVIRGLDRNEVVLDGQFELENGIRVLETQDSTIENLTVRGYTSNGIFWTGVEGYRGAYLTVLQNGAYGIYAYGSVDGVVEHSYAAGNPDAGLYIGQCGDCRADVHDFLGEWNGAGYSGANSSNVTVTDSVWRENRTGMSVTATSYEGCAPPAGVHIAANLVEDNGNLDAPATEAAAATAGMGIALAGARDSVVEDNEVRGQPVSGIAVLPRPEGDPLSAVVEAADPACVESPDITSDPVDLPETQIWFSAGNEVRDNRLSDNAWDLTLIEGSQYENCFSGNDLSTTTPPDLQELAACDGGEEFDEAILETTTFLSALEAEVASRLDYREVELPDPGPLEGMADPEAGR